MPIDNASVRHNKGASYRVWLRDYPVLLTLDRADYLAAFGEVEHVRPMGWCVRAIVQHTRHASRIMTPGWLMPTGSLVRCDS